MAPVRFTQCIVYSVHSLQKTGNRFVYYNNSNEYMYWTNIKYKQYRHTWKLYREISELYSNGVFIHEQTLQRNAT